MPRYLAFSPEQNQRPSNPLHSYTLNGTELLPQYFGTINAVNVLLGENNSGKSRFMREIMRSAQVKTIVDKGNFEAITTTARNLKNHLAQVKPVLDVVVKTKNTTRGSAFEVSFEKILALDLSSQNNEIRLNGYLRDLENISRVLDRSFESVASSMQTVINDGELDTTLMQMRVIVEKIRNIFKEIAAGTYQFHNNGALYNTNYHGFIFSPPFWKQDVYGRESNLQKAAETIMDDLGHVLGDLDAAQSDLHQLKATVEVPPARTYIPTLRSARTLIASSKARLEANNDIFLHTTEHDYDLVDSGVVVDTGFGLYEAVDITRNARHTGRTSFRAFEQFLSTTFFNGKTVEVVAERVKDERGGNILVSVAGIERDIHDLGDGIQSIIMLLYPLFIAPPNAWFFIEEPETHLHPGFQRLFIETITSNPVLRKKQLIVFLTTHSNHILDFALDGASLINLFTFRRQEGKGGRSSFQIQLSAPRDLENLNALGVQNSSVFLANCTLWVEGITDRLYFRAYLQAYWKHLQDDGHTVSLLEGLHYTFLEYAGANVEHYSFDELAPDNRITSAILSKIRALSVANRIMLIADQDAGKQTRHEVRMKQQHAGFVYHVLNGREIENLLTPAVLVKTLQGLYKKQTFDAAELRQSAYTSTYIGNYLRGKFPTLPDGFAPRKGSGTIGSSVKRRFAEEAIKHITWDSMGATARNVTIEIHNFIMAHNPRLGSN